VFSQYDSSKQERTVLALLRLRRLHVIASEAVAVTLSSNELLDRNEKLPGKLRSERFDFRPQLFACRSYAERYGVENAGRLLDDSDRQAAAPLEVDLSPPFVKVRPENLVHHHVVTDGNTRLDSRSPHQ
jgi:hypothetical protein